MPRKKTTTKTRRAVKPVEIKKPVPVEDNTPVQDATDSLHSKLDEISGTHTDSPDIPKGNKIEQDIETQIIQEDSQPKNKGGRPRGARNKKRKTEGDEQEDEKFVQIDLIAQTINGMAVPILAMKFNKKVEDCMLSKEQIKENQKLQPETDFLNKPSWPGYFIATFGALASNFFTAKANEMKEEIRRAVKEEVKNTFRENSVDGETTVHQVSEIILEQ